MAIKFNFHSIAKLLLDFLNVPDHRLKTTLNNILKFHGDEEMKDLLSKHPNLNLDTNHHNGNG